MNIIFGLLAVWAAVLSSTACSQIPIEFHHGGVIYVGVPVETWEAIVARRLDVNQVSRSRARAIVLLKADIADADAIATTYKEDAAEAKKGERDALLYAASVLDANVAIQKKLRRRTPWATAMKIEVCLVLSAATFLTIQHLTP